MSKRKKVKKAKLEKLTNEQWLELHTEAKLLMEELNPVTLKLGPEFINYCLSYDKAVLSIKDVKASVVTPEIKEADKIRDYDYNQIRKTVKSCLKHYDPIIRSAAEKINIVLKRYGDVTTEEYNDESATIMRFIQELMSNFSAEINALELTNTVNALRIHNDRFRTLMAKREKEYYAKSKTVVPVPQARKEHDDCYRNEIVAKVDAMLLIDNTALLDDFVDRLNLKVDHYNRLVAIKEGRNKAKREKKS